MCSRRKKIKTVIVVSVEDKMIIKLHNWIYFFTMIMTMIEGNYDNSFSSLNIILLCENLCNWCGGNGFF